jgi:RNA polymerase sigma-70 factor (ECF subfamily)
MLTAVAARPAYRPDTTERLVDAYASTRPELVAALTRMLGSREDALDAAQTAFLKCWRTRARLPAVRDLKAWVFRVGLNAGRDLRRDAWRRRCRPLGRAEPPAATPDPPYDHEAVDRLRAALSDLRPAEREVFLLRQTGSRTFDEIAALCRVPVGTVKTRMRSARIKLRGMLAGADPVSRTRL